jgi:alkylhydroperoxidase family enzyme
MMSADAATTLDQEQAPMPPVDAPRNLFVRLLYWATRRRYGQTPMVFRVAYSRAPWIGFATIVVVTVLERLLRVRADLRILLQTAIAMRDGCQFCEDLARADAIRLRVGHDKFRDLPDFETSASFSPQEKAALAYARALRASPRVDDAVMSRLRGHFSAREVIEIVWVCAVESYFTCIALPLRLRSDGLATHAAL